MLRNNGGDTETVALLEDTSNPALDGGDAGSASDTDQRGQARFDVPGVANNGSSNVDIGAYERLPGLVLVTTAADDVDAEDGVTSLREAVALVNSRGDGTITFDPTVFTGGDASLIRLEQGALAVGGRMIVDGSTGTDIVITGDADGDDETIDADSRITDMALTTGDLRADNTPIFDVTAGSYVLQLTGLTLTGAVSTDNTTVGSAVYGNDTSLALTNSLVRGNYAYSGGAIGGYEVSVSDSTISDNIATFGAGGVATIGGISVTGSTIARNEGRGAGGLEARGGNVEVNNSTIAWNAASFGGGGIYAYGPLTLINTTVTGNSTVATYYSGGAFYALDGYTLINSIVLGNTEGDYGQIYSGGVATNINSLVAGNPAQVFEQTTANGATRGGVLADNGGGFETVALLADVANPALDAGLVTDGVSVTDQRGQARVTFPGALYGGSSPVDLGAFEVGLPETGGLLVTTNLDVVDPFDGLTSLREAVRFANTDGVDSTITSTARSSPAVPPA